MGAIRDAFDDTFRDFATDGVSGSGAHEPDKSEIRAIGVTLETAMAALSNGVASVIKTTKALLDADLDHAANTVAIVYADPTAANNDVYIKVGASGAGSWTQTSIFGGAIEALAQPYVDAAEAAADIAAEQVSSIVIGPEPTGSLTTAGAGERIHARPIVGTPVGPVTVTIRGGTAGGNVGLRRYTKSGDTFTQVGSGVTVAVGANATVTEVTTLEPVEGEYLGCYAAANVIGTQTTANDPGAAYHYSNGTDSGGGFTDDLTTFSIFSVKFEVPVSTSEEIENVRTRASTLEEHGLRETSIGPATPTPISTSTTSAVRVHRTPIVTTPLSTLRATIAGGPSGGRAEIKRFTKSGDDFTQVGEGFTVLVPALDTITVDTGQIPQVGEYLGLFVVADCVATGPAEVGWYAASGGTNLRSFTDTAATTTSTVQCRFFYGASMNDAIDELEVSIAEISAGGDTGTDTSGGISIENRMAVEEGGWTYWGGYGQSLSIGARGMPALSVTQPYENLTFVGGPKSSGGADVASAVGLFEDNKGEDATVSTVHGETILSSGANHATRLAALNRGDVPADNIIFRATAGEGGAAIAALAEGSAPFIRLTTQITEAKALADAVPKEFVVSAIDFLQGESDADDDEATYRTALETLQADIEDMVQTITGQTAPVHMLMYQVGNQGSGDSHAGGVFLAQLHTSNESEIIHCVTPTYHIGREADGTHMTNLQYIRLGHYLGRAYEELRQGNKPENLRPISATADGTTAYIRFHVPTAPLVIDTTTMEDTTDNGIRIHDDTGDLTLSGMTVMADGVTLQITLNRVLGANPKVRVGMDYLAAGLGTMNGAASANLRDSTTDTYTAGGTSYPLWHASMADVLDIIVLAEAYP